MAWDEGVARAALRVLERASLELLLQEGPQAYAAECEGGEVLAAFTSPVSCPARGARDWGRGGTGAARAAPLRPSCREVVR